MGYIISIHTFKREKSHILHMLQNRTCPWTNLLLLLYYSKL